MDMYTFSSRCSSPLILCKELYPSSVQCCFYSSTWLLVPAKSHPLAAFSIPNALRLPRAPLSRLRRTRGDVPILGSPKSIHSTNAALITNCFEILSCHPCLLCTSHHIVVACHTSVCHAADLRRLVLRLTLQLTSHAILFSIVFLIVGYFTISMLSVWHIISQSHFPFLSPS